jgi:hypothetical protein
VLSAAAFAFASGLAMRTVFGIASEKQATFFLAGFFCGAVEGLLVWLALSPRPADEVAP